MNLFRSYSYDSQVWGTCCAVLGSAAMWLVTWRPPGHPGCMGQRQPSVRSGVAVRHSWACPSLHRHCVVTATKCLPTHRPPLTGSDLAGPGRQRGGAGGGAGAVPQPAALRGRPQPAAPAVAIPRTAAAGVCCGAGGGPGGAAVLQGGAGITYIVGPGGQCSWGWLLMGWVGWLPGGVEGSRCGAKAEPTALQPVVHRSTAELALVPEAFPFASRAFRYVHSWCVHRSAGFTLLAAPHTCPPTPHCRSGCWRAQGR